MTVPIKGTNLSRGFEMAESATFPNFIKMKIYKAGTIHVMKKTPSVAPIFVDEGRIFNPERVIIRSIP